MHAGACHVRRTCWRAAYRGYSPRATCAPAASSALLRPWVRDRSAFSSCIGCCASSPKRRTSVRSSHVREGVRHDQRTHVRTAPRRASRRGTRNDLPSERSDCSSCVGPPAHSSSATSRGHSLVNATGSGVAPHPGVYRSSIHKRRDTTYVAFRSAYFVPTVGLPSFDSFPRKLPLRRTS